MLPNEGPLCPHKKKKKKDAKKLPHGIFADGGLSGHTRKKKC